MTLRHVDLALRHKILLGIPILLGLLAGILWTSMSLKDNYLSVATVWVERPTSQTGGSFTEFNQWISPAQNQVNAMRELLSTRSFRADVLDKVYSRVNVSPLTPLTAQHLTQDTFISPIGTHGVTVGHQSLSPVNAHAVVEAILETYTELYTAQIMERSESGKAFYEEQLSFASASLEKAHTELNTYLTNNPIAGEDPDEPATQADVTAAAASDLNLARLIGADETARETYDRIFREFADIQIAANSAAAGNANFRLIDPPEVPASPQTQGKRSLLLKPMLGLVGGAFISGGLFILMARLDRRLWLPADLEALGLTAPVMTLPHLKSPSRQWPKTFVRISTALRSGLSTRPGTTDSNAPS